ncbi:uncharacterized protein L3040_000562 [Drepanopeziza brunnea f. sp. 'multigermtubi']|uniref:uncharacterized protein n=1 Tax=Drepanopeziza brunnea f. sp. 'multigermtubi' TaxID=698441 RepID=UPI00238F1A3E|nr:hypothetical protein L3040_000562 [Drepanopeziza brunnea f. sp. 'multigermtubi']
MRFSTVPLLALPVLAAAQESPLEQAKAQAEFWYNQVSAKLSTFSSYIPKADKAHSPHIGSEAAVRAGGKTLNILTLNHWEETIRSSVTPESTTPEEWWVLITGGNKTCFGQCGQIEDAFNETAALWSLHPTAPHLGYLNCENQPVLCNAWSAGPPSLFFFEVPPKPAPVIQRSRRLNTTTTEVKTFTDLLSSQSYKSLPVYEGVFQPFDGFFAQYGLAIPLGYFFWVFAVIPNWMFMIGISFMSRSVMGNRMAPPPNRAAPPAGATPRR